MRIQKHRYPLPNKAPKSNDTGLRVSPPVLNLSSCASSSSEYDLTKLRALVGAQAGDVLTEPLDPGLERGDRPVAPHTLVPRNGEGLERPDHSVQSVSHERHEQY